MKITLLSIEGLEAAAEGWRLSRDVNSVVKWEDVFTVDVPVNELPTCHLLFEDFTILEREIFMSPRNHVAWARTSHVDDPLKFEVPYEIEKNMTRGFVDKCRTDMTNRKEAGASQDEWRENLPIMSTTSWTERISFRDLVKITGYFYRLCDDHRVNLFIRHRLKRVAIELESIIDKFTRSPAATDMVLRKYQKADFLREGLISVFNGKSSSAGFMTIGLVVPIWMRAQIVRHRNLAFVDDFHARVLCNKDVLEMTNKDELFMEVVATIDFWKSVLVKRSCWLAQDSLAFGKDLWARLIEQAGMDETMLPCADGSCPYSKDAALRLTDADPGTPCPRYCNINKIDKAPYLNDMKTAANSRPDYWIKEIGI